MNTQEVVTEQAPPIVLTAAEEASALTLASLFVGARVMLRCRADWRDATVCAIGAERVVLSVGSPSGRTYRVKRSSAASLVFDGAIPLLGEGQWRAGLVRYDARW